MNRVDKRFDKIVNKEIKSKVAEAFLDLETKIRVKDHMTIAIDVEMENLIKKKANQMKTELNAFIDSQVKRITFQSNIQANSDFPSPEGLEVRQNQRKK